MTQRQQIRKVIDSNLIDSPELSEFLSKSASNFAVLTDYAAMEAYKAGEGERIHRSMRVLCQYASQVIVLKSTLLVCGLSGRASGLQRRMIDQDQTRGFPEFCRALRLATEGRVDLRKQISAYATRANEHIDRITRDVTDLPTVVKEIESLFTASELRLIRTDQAFPPSLLEKFIIISFQLAAIMFRDHPYISRTPTSPDVLNTFIFRAGVCLTLLLIEYLNSGGPGAARPAKLRNDLIDVNFATYATFFDGLISNDKRPLKLAVQTKVVVDLLSEAFAK